MSEDKTSIGEHCQHCGGQLVWARLKSRGKDLCLFCPECWEKVGREQKEEIAALKQQLEKTMRDAKAYRATMYSASDEAVKAVASLKERAEKAERERDEVWSTLFRSHHVFCSAGGYVVGEGHGCSCRKTHKSEWRDLEKKRDEAQAALGALRAAVQRQIASLKWSVERAERSGEETWECHDGAVPISVLGMREDMEKLRAVVQGDIGAQAQAVIEAAKEHDCGIDKDCKVCEHRISQAGDPPRCQTDETIHMALREMEGKG